MALCTDAVSIVLQDLMKFCRMVPPTPLFKTVVETSDNEGYPCIGVIDLTDPEEQFRRQQIGVGVLVV
jgi:hypothetical protein